MNEAKKSFDPWRLILILVCAAGFFGGIYLLSTTINTRFDSVDGTNTRVSSDVSEMSTAIKRIDSTVTDVQEMMKAMEAKMAAPPPPAPPVASDDAAPPAAPSAKPAPAAAE